MMVVAVSGFSGVSGIKYSRKPVTWNLVYRYQVYIKKNFRFQYAYMTLFSFQVLFKSTFPKQLGYVKVTRMMYM